MFEKEARGAGTRQKLVDTALRLFREHGYQATTMRRIADEAGVSLGNTYYWFAGKDELVHELYRVIQHEHREQALPRLREGAPLAANLATVLHTALDVMAPYHGFGATFVAVALPSTSRTSPFSPESEQARDLAIDLWRRAVLDSRTRVPAALADTLPTLLWLVHLGVTLHWVTDRSPDQQRTRTLADGVAALVARAVGLARLPGAGGLVDDVVRLVGSLR